MSRSERLLDLIQILRRHRAPIIGKALADELGISLRTLYRDIATLQAQGAPIDGEAGIGYVLRPGFTLPPLMFSEDEIEALVLGSRWVAKRGDARLGLSARDALAKIAAILPPHLREELDGSNLLVGPPGPAVSEIVDLAMVRAAIRSERKLQLVYSDQHGSGSKRTIWPFAVGFFEHVRVVAAWCELRQDFRNFRTDRMQAISVTDIRYPRRRSTLLKEWRVSLGQRPSLLTKTDSGPS